ncbi:MAG: AIR synthase family protein [Anaerolineae bacterium]|nr:AIR synthase family protein [Anaerolineae bacterium]
MNSLPLGKLPPFLLADLLGSLPGDPRVVVGPRPGEDAAVIDMGDHFLVAKTDPITFASEAAGWYAVQVNANDIATTGAAPRWFMASILLPGGTADEAMARAIFEQLRDACRSLNVTVIGGHTEITYGLDRPVVTGVMLGEVAKDRLVTTGGARPGDVVLLTKGVPVEGIAILAREQRPALTALFDAALLDRCANFLYEPGISVVRDAQLATGVGGVTSMHDPTEGGLATALWELCDASGQGVRLNGVDPVVPEAALCTALGLDPWGVIASGALLLTAQADRVQAMQTAFAQAGIKLFTLGQVVESPGVVQPNGAALPRPARDEIARLFEQR